LIDSIKSWDEQRENKARVEKQAQDKQTLQEVKKPRENFRPKKERFQRNVSSMLKVRPIFSDVMMCV
jgi:hypothetical protein